MKRFLFVLLFAISQSTCFAQIAFEGGYFIKESGERVDCLIKNVVWDRNPKKFIYKLKEGSRENTATMDSVREFGIGNAWKYVRQEVDIDRSSYDIDELSKKRNPEFEKATLFLKVLVEGKATLFFYKEENLYRFFFQMNAGEAQQLVFKKYRKGDSLIGENNYFRQQLWNVLKCPDNSIKNVENIDYKRKDLINLFVAFNKCHDVPFTVFEKQAKRNKFNASLKAGASMSSLEVFNSSSNLGDADFGSKSNVLLGFEAELILPFHRNKWSVFVEPTYQSFSAETEEIAEEITVVYPHVNVSVGARHYFFISQNSHLFLTAMYIHRLDLGGEVEFQFLSDLDTHTRGSAAFGLGYRYAQRYSIEFRYSPASEVLDHYIANYSEYQSFSFVLGYTLFRGE